MLDRNSHTAGTYGASSLDEFHRLQAQDFAAREPGEHAQFCQPDGEDGVEEIGSECGNNRQRENQGRNCQQGVDHPHNRCIPESAQIRRDKSEDHPRYQRQGNGAGRNL